MKCIREWRVRRIKVALAGLKAKYDATMNLVGRCKSLPGGLVQDIQDFSQQIAEKEELLRQLGDRPEDER